MLALIAGVVAMHSLVACHPVAFGVQANVPAVATDHGAGHAPMPSAGDHGTALPAPAAGSASGGHDPMSALHHMLHLCLAVVTALLLAAVVLLAVLSLRGDRAGAASAGPRGTGPRAPPPPTSVRLAQLCVLRN